MKIELFLITDTMEDLINKVDTIYDHYLSFIEAVKSIAELESVGFIELEEAPTKGDIINLEEIAYRLRYFDRNYLHYAEWTSALVEKQEDPLQN